MGSAVVQALVRAGHQVSALSRSEDRDAAVKALGATPVRGSLGPPEEARKTMARWRTRSRWTRWS